MIEHKNHKYLLNRGKIVVPDVQAWELASFVQHESNLSAVELSFPALSKEEKAALCERWEKEIQNRKADILAEIYQNREPK